MKHIKVYLMLFGFATFTGATFNIAKYAVGYFSPFSAAAWRFGLASVIMLGILITTEGIKKESLRKNTMSYIIVGFVGIFGFNSLFFMGMKYTSPVNGALIMGMNPLLTTVLAWLLLKNQITKRQIIGIIFALIGIILVISHGSLAIIKNLSFSTGDLFILGGNCCWALYGVLGRRLVKNSTLLATTTYTMITGAICLIILSLLTSNSHSISLSIIPFKAWGAIIFMAFFSSVLGYLWWNKGIEELGPSKAAVFFNFVPVITMIISFVSGIAVTLPQLIGVSFVLAGVLTASGIIHIPKINQNKSFS